eukprot:2581133-Alexandrium_andersonii.AAC.1
MQIRGPVAPHEARRLRRPPLDSGAPNFCRVRAAEGALGSSGELGPRPPGLGFVSRANTDHRAK